MPPTKAPPRPPRGIDPAAAWEEYRPSPARPWNLARAAHLFRRAGFGAGWGRLQEALRAGPKRTIDRLLTPPPAAGQFQEAFDAYERSVGSAEAFRAWWLRRMIETPDPLREKLTLLWRDLFGVLGPRVGDAALLRRHVASLRGAALGRFGDLLARVAHDPAVYLSLGATANRRARPSDLFARQLLHRYTVGPAGCTDRDVLAAARATTGWFVLRRRLRFFPREHDGAARTVLGRTGRFGLDELVALAAGAKATARNIVRRFYRWFVSEAEQPDEALLAPLVEAFAANGDIARLVGRILRSNLFFSPAAMRRRIKRPVEFAVGLVRALEARVPTLPLGADLARLGEDLYAPPTVAGWAGGRYWINPATVVGRGNLAADLLAAGGRYAGRVDPAALARRLGRAEPRAAERFLLELLLQPPDADAALAALAEAPDAGGRPEGRLRRFVATVAALPEYQLA